MVINNTADTACMRRSRRPASGGSHCTKYLAPLCRVAWDLARPHRNALSGSLGGQAGRWRRGKDKEWGGREGGGFIAVGVRGWGCTDPHCMEPAKQSGHQRLP